MSWKKLGWEGQHDLFLLSMWLKEFELPPEVQEKLNQFEEQFGQLRNPFWKQLRKMKGKENEIAPLPLEWKQVRAIGGLFEALLWSGWQPEEDEVDILREIAQSCRVQLEEWVRIEGGAYPGIVRKTKDFLKENPPTSVPSDAPVMAIAPTAPDSSAP